MGSAHSTAERSAGRASSMAGATSLFAEASTFFSQRNDRPTQTAKCVAAIDQGTTSTRVLIFDEQARVLASHQMEHQQLCPKDGWCEHDPMQILRNCMECLDRAAMQLEELDHRTESGHSLRYEVASIGITNQRETTVVWDSRTGRPLYNAIVWLDTRTSEIADKLAADDPKLGSERFRATCGLPVSPYFSALKLLWLRKHEPKVAFAIGEGRALFGTMDTWLIWNLSGGPEGMTSNRRGVQGTQHVTDVTNASRTMLMDLTTLQWDIATCAALGLPLTILPRIASSSEVVAMMACTRLAGVPIGGVLGDQHASMLGQACLHPGDAKATYGTGCFVLMNVGDRMPVPSAHGLLSTVCFQLGPKVPACYALEGSVAVAGRAVQWLRDNLGVVGSAAELEALARSVETSEGVSFVPAFSGLLAPHWRPDARGVITGLSLHSSKAHICRACLDAVAMQCREVFDALNADALAAGVAPLSALKVDGGMAANGLLLQTQADVLRAPVVRPQQIETTALGAAYAAGLAVGVWESVDALGVLNPADATFVPQKTEAECAARMKSWSDAVKLTLPR